jgi:hypothetical protein
MNEKIKELAEQSHLHGYMVHLYNINAESGYRVPLDVRMRALEGFAELIVKECVSQLELVRKYRYDRIQPFQNQQTIIDECQYQIKQYFGVEE